MTIIHNDQKHRGEVDFRASVPFVQAPKIVKEKVVKGIKYYLGDNGKQYIADLYDKYFKRSVEFKIKGKYHKGNLIGQAAWR